MILNRLFLTKLLLIWDSMYQELPKKVIHVKAWIRKYAKLSPVSQVCLYWTCVVTIFHACFKKVCKSLLFCCIHRQPHALSNSWSLLRPLPPPVWGFIILAALAQFVALALAVAMYRNIQDKESLLSLKIQFWFCVAMWKVFFLVTILCCNIVSEYPR